MENNYLKPKDKKIYEEGYWKSNEPEILIGGERLGGARKFLADVEKAVEKLDQLSRQPGLNPEEIRRIYGEYLGAFDPEDEEKREKARAALERVIEKRIKRKGYVCQEYKRRDEKIKEDNLRQGWIDGWAKVGIPREAAAQIFDKTQFGEDQMGEKRITAGAAIAALAAAEEKRIRNGRCICKSPGDAERANTYGNTCMKWKRYAGKTAGRTRCGWKEKG